MPNLEVHYKHHNGETYVGRKMSVIIENFKWLGFELQKAVFQAYNYMNDGCELQSPDDVIVRFIEASEYDVGAEDLVFVIKCGPNGMSYDAQQMFCNLFDSTVISTPLYGTSDEDPDHVPFRLGDWLLDSGVSYSVELFNLCSHGFGKLPDYDVGDSRDGDKDYIF